MDRTPRMSPNRYLFVLALVAFVGCASARPPGTFADAGPFASDTLRLNADGTFSYVAWSDGGGAYWHAEGTWQWIDPDRFATQVTKITLGTAENPPLRLYQEWRTTSRGVIRDTPLFRRSRE